MLNFVERTADLGTTAPLQRKVRKYQGQTVTAMRQDLIERAQETIKALQDQKGRTLRAPMARSIRNGISVKIGYGKRNVGFFEGEGANKAAVIPERNFASDRKLLAIDYLQQAIAAVQAGELDELLSGELIKLKSRFASDEKSLEESDEQEEPELPNYMVKFAAE
jgi:hypothetical protein